MITTILAIYFGLGLVLVLGVAAAAKRPMPQLLASERTIQKPYRSGSEEAPESLRRAA